jgi:hypothetical protein
VEEKKVKWAEEEHQAVAKVGQAVAEVLKLPFLLFITYSS